MIMNSKFFLGLLIISSLLLSACNPNDDLTGNTMVDPNDSCSALPGSVKDDCYLKAKQCSKITSSTLRDSCVVELAKINNDLKVCDLIQSNKTVAYCQEQIAIATNDQRICS